MTITARYNLQKGKAENQRFTGTTYNAENVIDRYIIIKQQQKKKIKDKKISYNNMINTIADDVAAAAEEKIEELLKNIQ